MFLLFFLTACTDSGAPSSDDGAKIWDRDGDGVAAPRDCDDSDPEVYPHAPEICNDQDDDCDGEADQGLKFPWYADVDGDGFGTPDHILYRCEGPPDYVENAMDCDDLDPNIFPGSSEFCNEMDDDCNGIVDDVREEDASVWWVDADGDGFGAEAQYACTAPPGTVSRNGDCDDNNPNRYPGAPELCNDLQDNCADSQWLKDVGVVTFFGDDGSVTPEPTDPLNLTLDHDGTLNLCEGSYVATIILNADLRVQGIGTVTLFDEPTETILNGTSGAQNLQIDNLFLDGEGVAVAQNATLSNLHFSNGWIPLYAINAVVDIVDSTFQDAYSGLWARDSTLTIQNSSFDNVGLAIYISTTTITLDNTTVTNNTSHRPSPIDLSSSNFSCIHSTIDNNIGDDAVVTIHDTQTTLHSDSCTWSNNTPADLWAQKVIPLPATTIFDCDTSGCW